MPDVHFDPADLALSIAIDRMIPPDYPFEGVMASLEFVMAARIGAILSEASHPHARPMAVEMVARHLNSLLADPRALSAILHG